jgi:hypothetical protein
MTPGQIFRFRNYSDIRLEVAKGSDTRLFIPNAEGHSQEETEATEAEGLPNWKWGIVSSWRFMLQVVRSRLSLFPPVNPIPIFRFICPQSLHNRDDFATNGGRGRKWRACS